MKSKSISLIATALAFLSLASCNSSSPGNESSKDSTSNITNVNSATSGDTSLIPDKKNFETAIDGSQLICMF